MKLYRYNTSRSTGFTTDVYLKAGRRLGNVMFQIAAAYAINKIREARLVITHDMSSKWGWLFPNLPVVVVQRNGWQVAPFMREPGGSYLAM